MSTPAAAVPVQETVSIIIADDHQVVRSGLRLILDAEDGFAVVAEAADADGALRSVLEHAPDVLVLDLNLPGTLSSFDTIARIRERADRTSVVVLTMQEDPSYARTALQAGARGYVLKDAANDEVIEAVRRAAAGGTYVAPAMGAALAKLPAASPNRPNGLSAREIEVLHLIALGHTNAEIGELLRLSTRTVETHRAHIQRKLRRSTRAELVRYALDHRLLDH